jgi:NosR/NirI family nitrite reductase transcriptional regulator
MWRKAAGCGTRLAAAIVGVLLLAAAMTSAVAQTADLRAMAASLFGGKAAELQVGLSEGTPPIHEVRRGGALIGFIASTAAVTGSLGYSGKSIDILVAVDLDATIVGARLLAQSEPILTLGIEEGDIARYIEGFSRYDLAKPVDRQPAPGLPDAIAGATVSSGVIRDSIIRTGRAVALSRGLLAGAGERSLDVASFAPRTWAELLGEGAIARRRISIAEARAALTPALYERSGAAGEDTFIELYLALLNPPTIGQNLIGRREFERLGATMAAGDAAILVAANGLYSFKGSDWRRNGRFERIEIHQGGRTIGLAAAGHTNVETLSASDGPSLREAGIFVIPAAAGLDATLPFRLSLIASHDVDGARLSASFFVDYAIPSTHLLGEPAETAASEPPVLWQQNWRNRVPAVVFVAAMLTVLAAILVFQDSLSRHYRLYRWTRLGFLSVTLVVLGWGLGAQLSVVHVLAFVQALRTGFEWETFLLDPLVFILWSFVAIALLFWGRGVFCGWLCPFGALQELLNEAARALGVRQVTMPFSLHERLWPIKYVIFLGLFALSLHSLTRAFVAAEVEPFKTAITLHFWRPWPFVAFAVALLLAGLVIERFYCRYLCPLGAALAIPARLRMFDWLKRRPQCGTECRICATRCTVAAIHPDGRINPNECIHCLNCQTLYYDATTCPPLKARLQRQAAHRAAVAKAGEGGGRG